MSQSRSSPPDQSMFQWIGKLLSGVEMELPPGVSATWVATLEKTLAPLDSVARPSGGGGLAGDLLRYVLQGEPASVLSDVGQAAIRGPIVAARIHREADIYEGFDALPGDVMLRWARLLEAFIGSKWHSLQFASGIHWPDAVLAHASGRGLGVYRFPPVLPGALSVQVFERMLAVAGEPESSFVQACFASPVDGRRFANGVVDLCPKLAGMGDAIARHPETIRPLLLPQAVPQRLHVLELLGTASPQTLASFATELAELATSSSKQVRLAAEPLLSRISSSAVDPLRTLAQKAKPDQRTAALRLLWSVAAANHDDALRADVREIAAQDQAPSVRALVDEWASAATAAAAPPTHHDYEVPVIEWTGVLSPAVERALDDMWTAIARAIEQVNERARKVEAAAKLQGRSYGMREIPPVAPKDLQRLRDYLAASTPELSGKPVTGGLAPHLLAPILERFAAADGVGPMALVKTLVFFGAAGRAMDPHGWSFVAAVNAMHRAKRSPTLLELQELLEPVGTPARAIFLVYCSGWGRSLARDWPDKTVWPFFAANVELLVQYLNPTAQPAYGFERGAVFKAIATLPAPPPALVNALYDLALGTLKTERPRAELALARLPGKEVRIVAALSDGKSDVRAVAADWLKRLRHHAAIPALEAALKKEKNDVAKAALLDALETLGQPIDKYFDRAAFAADMRKIVAKDTPKDLAWMPWDSMPRVRWADTGEDLGADVLRGLVIQAWKQKSPEPNAMLRKYSRLFEPNDRERFGQFVLEAWLREDVRPIPPDDALARARAQAQAVHNWMQHSPQHFKDDPNFGKSVDELTATYLQATQRIPVGSVAGAKGVLAVAAACGGGRAAPAAARFLKEYYGTRASQGRSVIAMLAWIEHPSATQLVLSIGNRFRTKSFQEEATRQAEALAARKGWTMSELADRTIPSAGFDESNELDLSYGQRRFVARLLPDFKIELFNPEGKKIAALPEPRQDDDAELAAQAKKALSAAKKEIKTIVDMQTDRLYESLCTGRDWSFEDWQLYLHRHPVMRRLVQRLVWAVTDAAGDVRSTFRPLDDGTLTDVEDNAVTIEAQARVRIAHDSFLPADAATAWQTHLADYDVPRLFEQFGKGRYRLPDASRDADEITDFRGYLLQAFALRGRALKLGYSRGQAEDGGIFLVYEKRFPSLGITATIEFTGNALPEQNRTVALRSLYFMEAGGDARPREKMELSRVPQVLLSECYDDIRVIAADGSGFDADWEKKSSW